MIIADTGFWLALVNEADNDHAEARGRLLELAEPLISTWPVVTETCHLLMRECGPGSQQAFLRSFAKGAFDVFALEKAHVPRIAELMKKYEELPMDLADASLVVLAEHLGHGRILSTDQRDFGAYRWKQRRPFDNLLLSV